MIFKMMIHQLNLLEKKKQLIKDNTLVMQFYRLIHKKIRNNKNKMISSFSKTILSYQYFTETREKLKVIKFFLNKLSNHLKFQILN